MSRCYRAWCHNYDKDPTRDFHRMQHHAVPHIRLPLCQTSLGTTGESISVTLALNQQGSNILALTSNNVGQQCRHAQDLLSPVHMEGGPENKQHHNLQTSIELSCTIPYIRRYDGAPPALQSTPLSIHPRNSDVHTSSVRSSRAWLTLTCT